METGPRSRLGGRSSTLAPKTMDHRALLLSLALTLPALPVQASQPTAPAPAAQDLAGRLAGTWVGISASNRDRIYVLDPDGKADLDGLAARWRVRGEQLELSAGGERLSAGVELVGDRLTLTIDGVRNRFRRREAAPSPSVGEGEGRPATPPPLEGVDRGPGSRWQHPRGWYSFTLPAGWSVEQQLEEGLLVNPGLAPGDSLDGLVFVFHGELEADERDTAVEELTRRHEADVRALMAQQGIRLDPAAEAPRRVLVGELPGCEQSWRGRTAQGQTVRLWVGLVAKREYWLATLALVVEGHEQRFLPGAKRVFTTLEPTPPERDPELEARLVGRKATRSESNPSGYFSTTYRFEAGGGVHKEHLFSSGEVSGNSEDRGRYEVVGDVLYLYFPDGQSCGTVEDGGVRFGQALYAWR